MPTQNIVLSGAGVDLSPRFQRNATVVASPTVDAEVIIASITVQGNLSTAGIMVIGFAAYTVGTAGVSVNLRLRKTDASGSVLKATGATTAVAADLGSMSVVGFDTAPTLPAQVYVMTMTVVSANAGSTVSAVEIAVIVL